ncbi:hypothetical protein EOK75_00955 [Pseudorhodobacter turbinis]|uniref:Uncharacterized protein n=1 Tax=Pseudorhodobacter turbinis TaxID=2500533 RepID=A0A4P8ECL0_9RHOB|nr:hypothetical protein [Pseudorhodobacter turbinis]QCO54516.1 hypothetical protein EOK75_00955 [Pseudorhodobacter turbinis]
MNKADSPLFASMIRAQKTVGVADLFCQCLFWDFQDHQLIRGGVGKAVRLISALQNETAGIAPHGPVA